MNTIDRNVVDPLPVQNSDFVDNNEQEDLGILMNTPKKQKKMFFNDDVLYLNDAENLMAWLSSIQKDEKDEEDCVFGVQQDDAENADRKQEEIARPQQDEAPITHANEQVVGSLEKDLAITTKEQNKPQDTSDLVHLVAMDIFLLSYCNECKEKMNSKIYMCCDCYVCEDCVSKQQMCPICKQERILRNRYIEKIIKVVNKVNKPLITPAQCLYKKRGCGMRGDPTAVFHHEMVCEHIYTKCFLCFWYGRYFQDLQNHLKLKHANLIIQNGAPFSTSHTFQIIIAHNQTFVLKRSFSLAEHSISFMVYHITPRRQTTPYYYYICFTLESGELGGVYNEECVPGTVCDVLDQAFFRIHSKMHLLHGNICASMYLLIREGPAFSN